MMSPNLLSSTLCPVRLYMKNSCTQPQQQGGKEAQGLTYARRVAPQGLTYARRVAPRILTAGTLVGVACLLPHLPMFPNPCLARRRHHIIFVDQAPAQKGSVCIYCYVKHLQHSAVRGTARGVSGCSNYKPALLLRL